MQHGQTWGICRGVACALLAVAVSAVSQTAQAQPSVQPAPPAVMGEGTAESLIPLVDQAIAVTKKRNLDFQQHTPWQILHGLLALRSDYILKDGNRTVNALDFICSEAKYKGERWFEATQYGGRAHPYNGVPYDFEGHVNQSLAIIAMCDLPLTHEFKMADGKIVTMGEMINHAQMMCNSREETTWTLWLLTHYLDQDTQWTNAWGQKWSMETLVRIQTAASPYNAPCGGCHGMFALAYSRNAYMRQHGALRGSWLEADQKLQTYIAIAKNMQNQDGSFATNFFQARGFSNDFNERIKSSGHMLEWLLVALPRQRIEEEWMRRGIETLANDMIRNATQPADCGPLYHSLHALILFKQRIQPEQTPEAPAELAQSPALESAGPLTLSAPSTRGESMPLGDQEQAKREAATQAIVNTPSMPIVITPAKPANPSTEVKSSQILISPPSTEAPVVLKPAVPSSAPKLIETPSASNAKKPLNIANQQETLRKLSGEGIKGSIKPPEAEAVGLASELAPLVGGMPILLRGTSSEPAHEEMAAVKAPADEKEPSVKAADADHSETK